MAALSFFIMSGFLAAMFAIGYARHQAYVDKLRQESAERIAGWEKDFQRRLDEFKAAHPTAKCINCWSFEDGACRRHIRAPREFCLGWDANPEHDQALRMQALSDAELMAEVGCDDLAKQIDLAEKFLTTDVTDALMRLQGARFVRLARWELVRRNAEAQRG